MKLNVLMSTMDNNYNFFIRKNIFSKCIIVNQNNLDKKETLEDHIELFNSKSKGLSSSRNIAISNMSGDIGLIADNDVVYIDGYQEIILNAFKKYSEYDIITFQVKTPEGTLFNNYPDKISKHNLLTIMKVCSIEIAFKKESLNKIKLRFDENFGLGSTFPTGEEAIFLSEALKKNLKILYLPIPIVIHPKESSGSNYTEKLIMSKGAMLYRIFGKKGYIVAIIFTLKKYKCSQFNFIHFYNLMIKGIKKYKEIYL